MHKRSEPRFQVQSAVKVAALEQPTDVSDALLLDVSGAGMKIIAGVWWPVDTRVVVEMENHVVVAAVRNVNPRGPKFSLGAEKLISVLKHTLPADASREEWHKLLLAEIGEPQETPSLPPALMRESSALREPGMIQEGLPLNGMGAHYEPAGNMEATPWLSAPAAAKEMEAQPEMMEAQEAYAPGTEIAEPAAIAANLQMDTEVYAPLRVETPMEIAVAEAVVAPVVESAPIRESPPVMADEPVAMETRTEEADVSPGGLAAGRDYVVNDVVTDVVDDVLDEVVDAVADAMGNVLPEAHMRSEAPEEAAAHTGESAGNDAHSVPVEFLEAATEADSAAEETKPEAIWELEIQTVPEVVAISETVREAVAESTRDAGQALVSTQNFAPQLGLGQGPASEQTPPPLPMFLPRQTYTAQEILPQLTMALEPMPHEEFGMQLGAESEAENVLEEAAGEQAARKEATGADETGKAGAAPMTADAMAATAAEEGPFDEYADAPHMRLAEIDFAEPVRQSEISEESESISEMNHIVPGKNEIVEAHDVHHGVADDTRVSAEQHEEGAFAMKAPEAPLKNGAPEAGPDAPPMAAVLPKLPSLADPGRYMAPMKIAPQFGPAYGMAPTADVLTPISTMPAAQPEPPRKATPKKWIASSGLAAALLVVAALAFYYGPFRPTATSATRTVTPAAASGISNSQRAPSNAVPVSSETTGAPEAPQTASAKPDASASGSAMNPQAAVLAKVPVAAQAPAGAKAPVATQAPVAAPPNPGNPQVVAKAAPPAPAPPTAPTPTVPARAVAPTIPAPSGMRHAVLKASSLNWVAVCSDTKAEFSKVLHENDTIEIDFQHSAVFHIGTAGAAQINVDGKSIGPIGAPGEVKMIEISAAGVQPLGSGITADSRCSQLRAAAKH
jgi:hypothetical protein